jgi:hypothetical protein
MLILFLQIYVLNCLNKYFCNDLFQGANRGYAVAIPEQQPTVAHTYELSLPIKLLPGEDDVKLREGILIISSCFSN